MSPHNSLVQFSPLHLLLIKTKNVGTHALEKDRGVTIIKKTHNRTILLILRRWLVGRLRQTRRKKKIWDPHLSEVCSLPALFLHLLDSQFSSRLKQLGFQIKAASPLCYCTRFLFCFFVFLFLFFHWKKISAPRTSWNLSKLFQVCAHYNNPCFASLCWTLCFRAKQFGESVRMYSSGTWQLQCMSAAGQTVTNFHLLFSPVPFRYG